MRLSALSRSALCRLLLAALTAAAGVACSLDKASTASDDVTSVENTGVKSQAIANCWLYATAGWAESLHKGATSRDVDLSEAYWNYWYWYEQITGGDISLSAEIGWDGITQGGWWGLGVELIERYGWMYEGDFIPDSDAKAKRHEEAVAAINASLSHGALASPEARRDPKIVRAELDKAWQIGAVVVEDMQRQFPIVSPRTAPAESDGGPPAEGPAPTQLVSITARAASGSLGLTRIHAPQELPVVAADGVATVTLADAVGTRAAGTKAGDGARVGAEAWTEVRYTWTAADVGRRRALLKNVQYALNHRLAVPMAWAVSNTAKEGEYHGQGVSQWSLTGLHESILVDYEVDEVPGFGTLKVDVRETRPEALEATLDDAAKVKFFRIKNSWGVDPVWTPEEMRQYGISPDSDSGVAAKSNYLPTKPGFNNLFVDYLDVPTSWGNDRGGHLAVRLALPTKLRFDVPAFGAPPAPKGHDAGVSTDAGGSDAGAVPDDGGDAGVGVNK